MSKTLQKQLPLLSLAGLRDFAAGQTRRHEEVKRLLAGAQAEIAKIDAEAKQFFTGGTRRVGNTEVRINNRADAALQAQVADRKGKVRMALDEQLRALHKQIIAAKAIAKEYATRHWSKAQVLNRATTGSGVAEGLARRAHYATIFERVGKAQLFDFGQLAIDTGDAILGDAVYRAVMTRARDERPFQPAEFITILPNGEFDEASAILQSVMDEADQAGIAIATFEGRTGQVSLSRITMGLQGLDDSLRAGDDDMLDEAGGIKESALVRFNSELQKGR